MNWKGIFGIGDPIRNESELLVPSRVTPGQLEEALTNGAQLLPGAEPFSP